MKLIYYNDIIDGEPEMRFWVDEAHQVNLWEGTFNTLMDYGIPNENGVWEGILLTYHLHIGFYEESDWEIPSLIDYIKSLEKITVPEHNLEVILVKNKLVQLLQYAIDNNKAVQVRYW